MIGRITLKNFKCFESQVLTLGKLSVLAGLNGMGKSSVLQALLLIRQSYITGLLPSMGLALNGTLIRLGTAQDVLYEGALKDEIEIWIGWTDKTTDKFLLQYNREADVLKIDASKVSPSLFDRVLIKDGFHYLQAERLGPRITNEVSEYQVREHRQIGTAGEYCEHFLYLYGAEKVGSAKLRHSGAASDDLKGQVQAWLQEISPGAELKLDMHSEMDIINLRYSFVTGRQRSNAYRPTSVGFGITYALPVLVAVLSSKPGDLVMIENPEAHLHPRGQFLIGELFARAAASGIQLIIETHSDHVLNGIRVAVREGLVAPTAVRIHYFSREETEGRVHIKLESPIIDNKGRLNLWPEGFFDEWDKSLERLLAP
jgi:predicted ATPase